MILSFKPVHPQVGLNSHSLLMDKKQVLLSITCGFLKGGEGQHGVWANPSLPEYPHIALFVSGDLSVCFTSEDTNAHELGKTAGGISAREEQG